MARSKTNFITKHKETIIGAILLPLIALLIGFMVNEMRFSWKMVFLMLAIIALVIFASFLLIYILHHNEQKIKNKGCWHAIELLHSFKAELKHESLITYEDLERIEEEVEPKEKIFIFTKEFKLDEDSNFQNNVILKNFKEEVEYIYLIPDERAKIDKLKKIVSGWIRKNNNVSSNSKCNTW